MNDVRLENGLCHLKIHCIDLVEGFDNGEGKEHKLSSSNQRMNLLGTRLKEPKVFKILILFLVWFRTYYDYFLYSFNIIRIIHYYQKSHIS